MSELIRAASRRDVLKGGVLLGAPVLLKGAPVGKAIRVGLVGCGGRGTGAAAQALKADDYSELTAVADVYQNRIDDCLGRLKKIRRSKSNKRICSSALMHIKS
jgi:myo-inositol 2-dehydrogenase / D-chiro-inositol 1-dehydrogenase